MCGYSVAVEADVKRRMSPPQRQSVSRISEELGIHVIMLYKWRKATLRSLAINVMRVDEIWSITECIASLANDIKGLPQPLGLREPTAGTPLR